MILYYAGGDRNPKDVRDAIRSGARHFMLSYFYWKSHASLIRLMRSHGVHLMLDSGAFSAWKQGGEIDVNCYIAYIQRSRIGKYIALDVVGDPEKSDAHVRQMEEAGLHPIPVFHFGSDFRWLDRYAARYPYIALGGTVGKPKRVRDAFFAEVFARHPQIHYHGLGMTTPELLSRYPWFSVDSTTWLVGKKQGRLVTDHGQVPLEPGMSVSERVCINVAAFVVKERELAKRNRLYFGDRK